MQLLNRSISVEHKKLSHERTKQKNEQEEFKVLDPVQLHAQAVKRNHTPQLPNESVPMDPKARVKLSKPSEAPSMFSEDAKDNS